MRDVLIVCCDGLTGLAEAIEATWPQATVQTCVVHLIRAAMRFVSYGDRKAVAALKPIYQAANAETAPAELAAFGATELGRRYPLTSKAFRDAWERFTPFLAFPPELRRVIYTTNSIESLNYQLRKITQEPWPLPLRHGRRQAAVAGDPQPSRTGAPDSGTKRKGYQPTNEKHPADSSREQQPPTGNKEAYS